MQTGVFEATKRDGSLYYRASINYRGKHISLGSFSNEQDAHEAYIQAGEVLTEKKINLLNIKSHAPKLSFEKAVCLINFRDNRIYFKNPIYLQKGYFFYYLSSKKILKFDNDDLFYYASHKIQQRGNHLFVSDYGTQYSLLGRYGIRAFAVAGRDYSFANGDETDLRYSNIIVINRYHGVQKVEVKGLTKFKTVIHINGDFIIGRYSSEDKAAVAYNKAADFARSKGFNKQFPQNYVEAYSPREYAEVYTKIKLPEKYLKYFQ